jgi:FtsP/CotA-like multicopper oxidase with cupredoxin domain
MDKPNPADNPLASPDEPWKDVSVNYVPVIWNGASSPLPSPKLSVGAGERQFWRIANASADTHFFLKLQYRYIANGVWQDQPLEILARDGVPHTDDRGSSQNGALITKSVILPPGGRIEFIMTGPSVGVEARLFSDDYNDYLLSTNKSPSRFDATDRNPPRVLAEIQTTAAVRLASSIIPLSTETLQRFTGLRSATNVRARTVIFTKSSTDFFMTLEGNVPKPFDMSSPPDIVVNMPAVEEWTVENRDNESHVFHIHQVHFRVVEINGIRTDEQTGQTMRDTIELPACRDWGTTNPNAPYANDPTFTGRNCLLPTKVKLRMDFREKNIAGTLVYHCHILEHEDKGMMAKIKLVWNPAGAALAAKRLKQGGAKALAKAEQQQRRAGVNMHASPPAEHSAMRPNAEKAPGIIRTALPLPKTTGLADRFGKPIDQEICTTNSAPRPAIMQEIGYFQ